MLPGTVGRRSARAKSECESVLVTWVPEVWLGMAVICI